MYILVTVILCYSSAFVSDVYKINIIQGMYNNYVCLPCVFAMLELELAYNELHGNLNFKRGILDIII